MWRAFWRWCAVIIVLGVFSLPAQAQEEPAPKAEVDPPVKEYTVAALTIMLVMVVVCKPSRNPR
jgi:hypothetical protein